ncbi:MAG: hypothetical protein Q8L85_08925 [Alphaproteobacteria bacterium]|nr:hypothetical protein [Alphaproteobacteria bacterium]
MQLKHRTNHEDLLHAAKECAINLLLEVAQDKPQCSAPQAGSDEQMTIFPTLEQRLRASLALVCITASSLNVNSTTNDEQMNDYDPESLRRLLVERLSR